MSDSDHYSISTAHENSFELRSHVYRVRLRFKRGDVMEQQVFGLEQRYDEEIPARVREEDLANRIHHEFLPIIKLYFQKYDEWEK